MEGFFKLGNVSIYFNRTEDNNVSHCYPVKLEVGDKVMNITNEEYRVFRGLIHSIDILEMDGFGD